MSSKPFSRLLPAMGLSVAFILACGGGDEEAPEIEEIAVDEPVVAEPPPEPTPTTEPEKKSVAIERKRVEVKFNMDIGVPVSASWEKRQSLARQKAEKEASKRGYEGVERIHIDRRAEDCGKNICKYKIGVDAYETKAQFAD